MSKSLVESKYLSMLLKCSYNQPKFTGSPSKPLWELDCPLCGGRKSQLVWMDSRSTYKFICPTGKSKTNCGFAGEFQVLLKAWNQPLWIQYLQEREAEGTAGLGWNCPKASQVVPGRRSRRCLEGRKRQVPGEPKISDPGTSGCISDDE
jgi:hypothetical protein